ncbi:MAG: ABC transporter permease subunit [Actinomycetota bacterium]
MTASNQAELLAASQQRPPLWRDAGVLKWVAQLTVLFLLVAAFAFLSNVAADNLERNGIPINYDWLEGPANIQLSEGIDTNPSTAGRALWAGFVTTLRLAIAGIVVSTILGVGIGLARLSNNWLASRAASVFIETLRNIPVLVQILLWFFIISSTLPALEAREGRSWFIASQKGISIPRVFLADGFYQWLSILLIGGVVAWFVRRTLQARQDRLGGNQHVAGISWGIFLVFAAVGWFVNPIMGWIGPIFDAAEEGWGNIPQSAMQLIISLIAVVASANWIRRFLNSRRTPAGLAKLIDDDYFRMAFSAFGALFVIVVIWRVWPGLASWVINSGSDGLGVIGDKFGDGRGSRPLDAMLPTVSSGRFANFGPTGLTMTVFFAALFIGLVLYTASFIAEIVRGGILAVPRGQLEAASALGLSRAQSLRKVILPQAFRVIMPPLGNQYLNITKNTSLAIAVGLSDLVQVGQSIFNKNNQALAVFSIWMASYLFCSLTISVVVNYINRRLAIVER